MPAWDLEDRSVPLSSLSPPGFYSLCYYFHKSVWYPWLPIGFHSKGGPHVNPNRMYIAAQQSRWGSAVQTNSADGDPQCKSTVQAYTGQPPKYALHCKLPGGWKMKEFTLHPHIGKGLHTARGCLKDRQLIIERWSPCDLCIFSMNYLIFNVF